MKTDATPFDQIGRKKMSDLLRQICSDKLTGWEVHDIADAIASDDPAIVSILMVLEYLYAGWEKEVSPLDPESRAILLRCELFCSTDLPVSVPSAAFLTKRKFWFNKFDLDAFLSQVRNGVWPFANEKQMAQQGRCSVQTGALR